jgi:nucleotide-binding universal stress UspA family protein
VAESSDPRLEGDDGLGLVLVGVDGSETSLRAGAYAAGLSRRQNARLVVLYVATSSSLTGLAPGGAGLAADAELESAREIQRLIDDGAAYYGIHAAFEVRHGDPSTEFVRVADEMRADSVVVGASMRAGHRLIGSLGVKLVRAGKWPVTVVP